MQTLPILPLFANLRWQVFQVVLSNRRQLDVRRIVQIEILLWTIIWIVRRIETTRKEERLVVFSLQLIDRPVHTNRVGDLFLVFVRDGSPFKKESGSELLAFVINTCRKWLRNRSLAAPGIQRPTAFSLKLVAKEKLAPTALVNRTFRMMKQLARTECCVSPLGEGHLQCFDLRVTDKVVWSLIAAGRRSVLPGKNSSTTGGAEHSRRVPIRKIDAARCQPVDVRRRGVGRCSQAFDPVVHVINRKKQYIQF